MLETLWPTTEERIQNPREKKIQKWSNESSRLLRNARAWKQWQLSECFCSVSPLWEVDCRFRYSGAGSHRIHAALEGKIQIFSPSLLARCLTFQFATGVWLSLVKMWESSFLCFFCDGNCLLNHPLCRTHFDGLGNSGCGGGETANSLPLF